MNKKNTLKKTVALLMGFALTLGATGCDFVVTDNEKDLDRTVAKVDITKTLEKEGNPYASVAGDVKDILANVSSNISKRELISYFMSVGYQYVESYGYSYKDAFNLMLDSLINSEIMTQYAVAYYLKKGETNGMYDAEACKAYVNAQLEAAKGTDEYELLKAHKDVLTFKYFLTDGGKADVTEDYDRTVYALKKSLNSSLDSMESSYISETEEEHEHGESRTLPTGAGTADEEYYTNDYGVYTGYNTIDSCGKDYEPVHGSTAASRRKAYNLFLANLQSYNLIGKGEDVEDTRDVTKLDYYYVELSSSLGKALISKYFEDLEEEVTNELTADDAANKYMELYQQQEEAYLGNTDAFATALDGATVDAPIVYGLNGFGYVYNILLPFSTSQTEAYTNEKNKGLTTDELYNVRKQILTQVRGKDQRGSWISKDDHVNYSTEKDGAYYFFQDHADVNNKQYKALTHYNAVLPFNGTVVDDGDEYKTTATPVSVDDVIGMLETELGKIKGVSSVAGAKVAAYGEGSVDTDYVDEDGEVQYDKFVYYKGNVNFEKPVAPSDYYNEESALYNMLAVANEFMFAYSTDPGCLNSYMGYAISPYSTNFMKEFEYAAQEAVKGGVGTYYVAPTDYGWHIILTTFAYTQDGAAYYSYNENGEKVVGFNKDEVNVEGTFSNLYFESLKEAVASNYTTEVQNSVLNDYNNSKSVTRYKDRYKDLLEMDN